MSRTTLRDCIRLAWALYRCEYRQTERLGQMIVNAAETCDPCVTTNLVPVPIFYQNNNHLILNINKYAERVRAASTVPPVQSESK